MTNLISTRARRLLWSAAALIIIEILALLTLYHTENTSTIISGGVAMKSLIGIPAFAAIATFALLTACASDRSPAMKTPEMFMTDGTETPRQHATMAQIVGVQWLNPLQRCDYPTEWQLLWTLGLTRPNKNDDMVRSKPKKYSSLQAIAPIAYGNDGKETASGYHEKYLRELLVLFHDIYFSSSTYFYNAHSLTDKSTWREMAGIRVEYALPAGKLDELEATDDTRNMITKYFQIGNPNTPNAWSRSTPPDVHVTMGGPNAGFTSLSAALEYLQTHPNETVWAMNWDAPNFPPNDEQINENMVLLVLAGPNYKTDREPLAWIGYPASHNAADFEKKADLPSRMVQAWKATLDKAVHNAGKDPSDIGYVIHDANNTHADSSDRIGNLAHILTSQVAEFNFMKQSFNTPALLGDMGAGTALTNVALGIAYANHLGKNVLVAGTSELAQPTAVLVVPPAKVRPIDHDKDWFRARGGNNAYLMWWGLRHDAGQYSQGYSK